MHADPLRELVDDGQVEALLEALRKDLPDTIHLYKEMWHMPVVSFHCTRQKKFLEFQDPVFDLMENAIDIQDKVLKFKVFNRTSTHLRWRRHGLSSGVQVAVYRSADEGNATDGHTTTVSILFVDGALPSVVVHTTDPARTALRRALAASKHIPWEAPFVFEDVHERCIPDVLAQVRARGDPDPPEYPSEKMMLPKEECLKLEVRNPGPGLSLRPLQPHHAKAVNDMWQYALAGSETLLRKTIEMNPGLSWGVFPEDDIEGAPVSFNLGSWNGGQNVMHTADTYRKHGLGGLVKRATVRAAALRHGLDAHCNVISPNPAASAFLDKLGFKRVYSSSWIHWRAPTYTDGELHLGCPFFIREHQRRKFDGFFFGDG